MIWMTPTFLGNSVGSIDPSLNLENFEKLVKVEYHALGAYFKP